MKDICVLYEREIDEEDSEWTALQTIAIDVYGEHPTRDRYALLEGSLVIPRYLDPREYRDLEMRAYTSQSHLINSYRSHQFVADIRTYHPLIKDYTIPIHSVSEIPNLSEGAYVVKGITNSDKFKWNTHMFASNKAELANVVDRVLADGFLSGQDLIIRPFVPLKQLGTFQNGLPLSNEWRLFAIDGSVFSGGFYWPQLKGLMEDKPIPDEAILLADSIALAVKDHIRFVAIDIAQCVDGSWIVIEINDGCTSGLSCINPYHFYADLFDAIREPLSETIS